MINVDVANGYTETFVESVARVRDTFPKSVIMAGNVVTPNVVEELILRAGADIIRIGLGSGSSCRTRIQTGIGYPQLSAVIECADAAHGVDGQICSDGGCRTPGDIIKAFGGGSDFVALGGMFAGTAECDGEWIDIGIAKYLKFHGMASKEAQELWNGGLADYRSAEGKEVLVPFKGPVENVVKDIIGGVRSACTYVGATKLKSFTKRCTFIRVTKQYNDVFEKQNRIS
jgi:GMP reductase